LIITSERQLDDLLATPSAQDVDAMRQLEGDLVLLGAGGKMGPTMAVRAARAIKQAGTGQNIFAVSRFGANRAIPDWLEAEGVRIVQADLLDRDAYRDLPDAANILYLVGRKFGSTGSEELTWAMNAYVPALVCERYATSRVVALSSGNIYPFMPLHSGGATEDTPVNPVGEYAQSVLARERIFAYFAAHRGVPVTLIRLNYAVELRYGVLLDIGLAVFERRPVNLNMAAANVIWQGDANSVCLRAFPSCSTPASILNLTGPETVSVRHVSNIFAKHFGVTPSFEGTEAHEALLNNAGRCHELFGYPSISLRQIIQWTAQWIGMGGATHGKPTHFEVRDGRF
jgi:nucleoside-diphosphate-sugar epimerase